MSQRNIDFGAFPDDPNADAIRSAFEKVQLNFTEVFAGLGDQAVISVNKTAGSGIQVNQPTGNVVISANIANWTVRSSTLDLGISNPGTLSVAKIENTSQSLYIDLPPTAVYAAGDFGYILANTSSGNGNIDGNNITLTNNVVAGNVYANTGIIGATTLTGTLSTAAQTNITSVGTLSGLTVTAPITGSVTGSAATAGTVTTAAQPNITSVGTLSALGVNGIVTAQSFTANTGLFTGDGGGLSNIAGGNVGLVANATYAVSAGSSPLAGTVTTAAQPNITSVGTLSALSVTGNVSAGNVSGTGGVFTYVSGDGANLAAIAGANVSGAVANATHAVSSDSANAVAGSNVTGQVNFAITANSVAGANVSGEVTNAAIANSVAGANVSGEVGFSVVANSVAGANVSGTVANATYAVSAGTVETGAQPNITSTGTLTSLNVTGNIDAGNLTTTGLITGDGGGLSNISVSAGAAITNGTSNAIVDTNGPFRVSINGSANVVQVKDSGTNMEVAGSMSVSGGFDNNINFNSTANLGPESNVTITGGVADSFLRTDGAGGLTWSTAVTAAPGANTQVIFNDGSGLYAGNTGFTFNKTTGTFSAPVISGPLSTAAQPNITSVGTLTSLILGGSFNTNSDVITNAGNIEISAGTGSFKGNGAGLTNITGANVSEVPLATTATTAVTANAVAGANVAGQVSFAATANAVTGGNVSGEVGFASVANSVSGSNVVGAVSSATTATTAQTVTTAAQPNITSVGTLTGLDVNGLITAVNITANTGLISGDGGGLSNIVGSNVSGAVSSATVATSATTAGTVTTAAQPNITSVGSLTSLTVTGNVSVGNISATRGTFTSVSGDGANLTNITGSNVGGQVGFAAIANNVAGGNVTGVVANSTYAASAGSAPLAGTVTTAAQPNITSVSSFLFHSSSDSVSASGSSQGDAFTLTTEINRVTSASASNGIKLPVAQGGLVVFIINTVSNSFKVYPNTSDEINSLGTNNAFTHPEGATLQYICTNSTNWYTVGATYA
jgi:hypothetical protein